MPFANTDQAHFGKTGKNGVLLDGALHPGPGIVQQTYVQGTFGVTATMSSQPPTMPLLESALPRVCVPAATRDVAP